MSAKPRLLGLGELRAAPFLRFTEVVRGYVLDERTGALDEVP